MPASFEPKRLTRKQVLALKRALARRGLKLPKPGWCTVTTKSGGRYDRTVAAGTRRTSEVCHEIVNGKKIYTRRVINPPSWELRRRGPIRSSYHGKRWTPDGWK